MRFPRFALLLIASVLALFVATPAIAVKPITTTREDSFRDNPLYDCGEFMLIENSDVTYRRTRFFNEAGEVTRVQLHFTYEGTLTNSVTGKTLSDRPDPQLYVIDYEKGTYSVRGLIFSINVPGTGVVALDAGKIIFDMNDDFNIIFQSGPHHLMMDGFETNIDLLCAAFR